MNATTGQRSGGAASPPRRVRAGVFATYALMIFVATHWPQLTLPGPGRPDLWIHLSVFGGWMTLLTLVGWFGPTLSRLNIGTCAIVTLAYAAVDESTQVFSPGRTVSLEDFGANAGGVLLASLTLLAIAWWRGRRETSR